MGMDSERLSPFVIGTREEIDGIIEVDFPV